jgi:hypothetical protein
MASTMRGIAFGAMAGAAALFAAAPAHAREVDVSGQLYASGSVTVSWHGDPARGCEAAGLCAYSGSVALRPDFGAYDFLLSGRRLFGSFSNLDLVSSPPVVRVKRTEAGSEDGACVDVPSSYSLDVTATSAGRGLAHIGLAAPGLSAGRCAGPYLSGLLARLPRRTLSLARLARGSTLLDLSGSASLATGRFSGAVRSTLRVRFGSSSGGGFSQTVSRPPTPRRPRVRVVHMHAVYRVTRFAGTLSTSFGALAGAPCADLDACGVTGSSRWDVASRQATLEIDADARARRTDHGLRGALAAISRGPAFVFGAADLGRAFGTTTADVARSGATACHDTASAASPSVIAGNEAGRRLTFALGGEESFPPSVDLLRTGCPGPRDEDVLGLRAAAAGSIPIAALGQGSFDVRMLGSGRFEANGYSGTRSADFALRLRRISVRVAYGRAREIG